jgi:hypothetical protein
MKDGSGGRPFDSLLLPPARLFNPPILGLFFLAYAMAPLMIASSLSIQIWPSPLKHFLTLTVPFDKLSRRICLI